MSTRSLTRVFDGDQEIACMYRHCDGYPSGHGEELAEFLTGRVLVNGFDGTPAPEGKTKANGMPDLAAQIVSHFKDYHGSSGNIYLYAPGSEDEEYVYEVHAGRMVCIGHGEELYNGPWDGFVDSLKEEE